MSVTSTVSTKRHKPQPLSEDVANEAKYSICKLKTMKRRGVDDDFIPSVEKGVSVSQVSKTLLDLSVKDRNDIYEEVHGATCLAPEETPEFLSASLDKFHWELARIDRKPAYDRAQTILNRGPPGTPSSYIHTKSFKLRFLRCELFDAYKAAERYCKYLDLLLELHGEIALMRPIVLKDLSREAITFLRSGFAQPLCCRDRSGRRIVCFVPNGRLPDSTKLVQMVMRYMLVSLIGGDEIIDNDINQLETQRKGVVVVHFPSTQHVQSNFSFAMAREKPKMFARPFASIPLRMVALHFCLPNIPWVKTMSSLLVLSNLVPRSKYHFGNDVELRYQLQGYGIPTELIPITDTGNIKRANHKLWFKLRTYLETQAQQSEGETESLSSSERSYPPVSQIIDCPGLNDVVFRRGKNMNHHPGNAKFMSLIEERIFEHTIDLNTSPERRLSIEVELIEKVRQEGGRFLKWDIERGWLVDMSTGSDSKELQSKVHYAFRDFRKKIVTRDQSTIVNATSSTYAFAQEYEQKRKRCCNIQLPNEI